MGRKSLVAVAVAAGMLLAGPVAVADPAPAAAPAIPPIPKGVPIDAIASLAPAIIGAAAGPADVDQGSAPQTAILAQAKQLLDSSNLPPEIKNTLGAVITFLDGSGGGGPNIPKNGPAISQFLYPTIGRQCISDTADSVGTALAVPGPAKLPPPGPAAGQVGFVFTALGTKVPSAVQPQPMTVTWLNLDNRKTATQNLTDAANINHPNGPSTLSAIADTGSGRVLAVVSGSLTTGAAGQERTCSFLPTIGMVTVP
ncbi:hypothetical protein FOS14_00710 [Skermania sp. ID1734]|uniref:Rv1157c family protein n=1 Tax=Skermania sp. ID1734 TaxID=2597516 RepID=UPI00117EFD2C|nr:hypothetical protein [Skermania sp. ID1734]TSE01948.1 hypothetical protein FOS14_00710 [Skermania sp. ID1734]